MTIPAALDRYESALRETSARITALTEELNALTVQRERLIGAVAACRELLSVASPASSLATMGVEDVTPVGGENDNNGRGDASTR